MSMKGREVIKLTWGIKRHREIDTLMRDWTSQGERLFWIFKMIMNTSGMLLQLNKSPSSGHENITSIYIYTIQVNLYGYCDTLGPAVVTRVKLKHE